MNEKEDILADTTKIKSIWRLLWKTICKQNGQSERNGNILETTNYQGQIRKIEIMNRPITYKEIEIVVKEYLSQGKFMTNCFQWCTFIKHWKN